MHYREQNRASNTGRFVVEGSGADLRLHGAPGHPLDLSDLDSKNVQVLYPRADAEPFDPTSLPEVLVIPDGSWSQTQRMVRRVPLLRQARAVTVPPRTTVARSARARRPGGLATLEAYAQVIRLAGDTVGAEALEGLLDEFVNRTLLARGLFA